MTERDILKRLNLIGRIDQRFGCDAGVEIMPGCVSFYDPADGERTIFGHSEFAAMYQWLTALLTDTTDAVESAEDSEDTTGWSVGDVVRIKTGGPKMVVDQLSNDEDDGTLCAHCVYFDLMSASYKEYSVSAACLEVICER